jgi:hypothetical protein
VKGWFGVVSLVVVLAVVGLVASRQMKATTAVLPAAAPASGTAPPSAQQIPQQVSDDLNRALQQGAARRDEVDK